MRFNPSIYSRDAELEPCDGRAISPMRTPMIERSADCFVNVKPDSCEK